MSTYLVWVGLLITAVIFGIGVGILLAGPSGWTPGRTTDGKEEDNRAVR